jgi:hypothetical protein
MAQLFSTILTEAEESKEVRKGIFINPSKGTMTLEILFSDKSLKGITWEEYKKSKLVDDQTSEKAKDDFVKALLSQEPQFNKKVDYNVWVKKSNPDWMEKVDYIMKNMSSKYTKKGIKRV